MRTVKYFSAENLDTSHMSFRSNKAGNKLIRIPSQLPQVRQKISESLKANAAARNHWTRQPLSRVAAKGAMRLATKIMPYIKASPIVMAGIEGAKSTDTALKYLNINNSKGNTWSRPGRVE